MYTLTLYGTSSEFRMIAIFAIINPQRTLKIFPMFIKTDSFAGFKCLAAGGSLENRKLKKIFA
jgi:hypothetical protein